LAKKKRVDSDRIDDLIIGILRDNSRMSNTDIATKLVLSESAVRRRIRNLEGTGRIIKYTVEVDDRNFSSAITWVSVNPAVPTKQVSERLRGVKGVETVYETAGQFDIATIITGANIADVNKTIEGIRRIEGVTGTNTTMVLRTIH
jgi:DNA-binding Lrp family transcriptional regulator